MNTLESVFIIDDFRRILEIKDGKNVSFDDGYSYEMPDNETVHRIAGSESDPYVDGVFTPYASLEALEKVIGTSAEVIFFRENYRPKSLSF